MLGVVVGEVIGESAVIGTREEVETGIGVVVSGVIGNDIAGAGVEVETEFDVDVC